MAPRKEWTEWHLTPRGWEQGSTRREGEGNRWRDEPSDRMLSWQYCEIATGAGEMRVTSEETWRSRRPEDGPQIAAALSRYGEAPRRLE
jgi:hypothetical protein